jgi:hypothetical protein
MKETTLHLNQLFFIDISFFILKFIFVSFGNVTNYWSQKNFIIKKLILYLLCYMFFFPLTFNT